MTTPENGQETAPESPRSAELDSTSSPAAAVPRTRAEARAMAAAQREQSARPDAAKKQPEPLPAEMRAARDQLDVSAGYHPEDFYGASSSEALGMTTPADVVPSSAQPEPAKTPEFTAAPEPAIAKAQAPVLVAERETQEESAASVAETPQERADAPAQHTANVPDEHDGAVSRRAQILTWAVPAGLVVVAGALRFIGLDHPHELVFDETYYVKDSFSLSQFGYEAEWGDDANTGFVAGNPSPKDSAAFVVHPPLGKWIISLGFGLFGADNGWGWRSMTALAGVITVLLTYYLAKRLTRSVVWGGIAGLFVAIDGASIVMSRVALLDGILTMFMVLGVLFITFDRAYLRRIRYEESGGGKLGSILWNRPWIIAAGLAFGAASSVKWSGIYALAGFGIYLVVTDVFARYRSGAPRWWLGSLAQGAISFIYLIPVAAITYAVSWTGWIITSGGYNRGHSGGVIAALLNYHRQILEFHNGLTSPHPYSSPAWQWPLLLRPTSMYWEAQGDNVQAITAIPNPLIWWVGVVAVFYLIYRFAYQPNWSIPIVLTAIGVAYLPWLALPNRTIFQFYTVVMVPFLAIAIVLAMQQLAGRGKKPTKNQHAWRVAIKAFVWVAIALSLFFLPLWTGMTVPYWFWQIHMWMPKIPGIIPGWV